MRRSGTFFLRWSLVLACVGWATLLSVWQHYTSFVMAVMFLNLCSATLYLVNVDMEELGRGSLFRYLGICVVVIVFHVAVTLFLLHDPQRLWADRLWLSLACLHAVFSFLLARAIKSLQGKATEH